MENTARFCRMGVGYPYWEISNQNYQKYLALKKEYEEKCDSSDAESVWEHNDLENQKDYSGFIAIVFSAIYLESEAYTYLATNLGDSFAKKHLDKLDPLSKWVVGIQLVTGKPLPKNGKAYELCKRLFSYRNNIAHHKSHPMEWDAEIMAKRIAKSEKEFDEAVHVSNQAVKALAQVVGDLHDGLGKPLSFVHENTLKKKITRQGVSLT